MRFHLTCDNHPEEVIGEEVTLPNADGERFAVHHCVVPTFDELDEFKPKFAVSHIETGMRVAAGETIDEAIANACKKLGAMDEERIREAIRRGRAIVKQKKAQGETAP